MNSRKLRIGVALAAAVAVMVCVLVAASFRTAPESEMADLRDALTGAQEVQAQMGMFSSPDGTTSSLTDADLEAMAAAFDRKVDRYYAQGTYANQFYKWLNQDCLFRSHQRVVDNCIDGGVSQCDITGLSLSKNGTEAQVSATVTLWNKWVTLQEDGSYGISNPINQDFLEVKMVKEDGAWKVAETLSYVKGMTGYDASTLDTALPDDPQALEEIERNKAILAQSYDTFQAARAAVTQIDVTQGNYIALLG